MPDILGYLPDGTPTSVPQEAAGEAYRAGKLKFKPDDRVPIKFQGQDATIAASELDSALQNGDAELNFDPNGTAKAAAAGGLRGLTMGASDWLAVEGQKLIGDPEGAEKTRQALDALRKEHGVASSIAEIGGAVLPSLIPGGAETELARAGATGAREAAAASKAIGATGEALTTTQAISDGAQTLKGLAAAHADSGVTRGSVLARTLRAVNPYEYVSKTGDVASSALGKVLGEGRIAKGASALTRWGVEGALIGLAGAADERELGDPNLTGETWLAAAEHGALWGFGFGLVGSGAERILTAAGRMANRLSEAQLGGTPTMMRGALEKHGPGALGFRRLEEGESPFMSAEDRYKFWENVNARDGETLGRVVGDIDGKYGGVAAQDAKQRMLDNMEAARKQYLAVGGNAATFDMLEREATTGLGLKELPDRPPPIPDSKVDEVYERLWKEANLPDPTTLKKPRYPSAKAIENYAQRLVLREGIDLPTTPQMVGDRIQKAIADARAEGRALQPADFDAANVRRQMRTERAARKEQLYDQARAEMLVQYGRELKPFEEANEAHRRLANSAAQTVTNMAAEQERLYQEALAATRAYNEQLQVGFAQVRDVRARFDKIIPWRYANNPDAVANAAAELKLAARRGLEGAVEEGLDRAAARAGDQDSAGQYLHAKKRYAESADILEMSRHLRARHAALFGRPSRVGGIAGHVALGAATALTGHPLAGAALGVGGGLAREYGPKVAAWALHKATRLAQLKALRQEVLIGTRRGVRTAMEAAAPRSAEQVYYRVQPKGKTIFGHTSVLGSEPLEKGHIFAYKDPNKMFETYSWQHVKKAPEKYDIVEFGGSNEHQPEDTEGFAVRPEKVFRTVPLQDWLNERAGAGSPAVKTELAKLGYKPTAKVAVDAVPPHQLRVTAAQAMEQVAKLANSPAELRARLAALDPSLPVVAPNTFAAAEGAFRRQVQWLAQQAPQRLLSQHLQSGEPIDPRHVSDADARAFIEHASTVADPRIATDALATGTLTANQAKAYRAAWGAIQKNDMLQYKRMKAMNREGFNFLPNRKKGHLSAMFGDDDPSFTLALQANAASLIAAPPPPGAKGGPKGMSHASATSRGMAATVSLLNTQAQTAESGPPGRRGRSGRSADAGL